MAAELATASDQFALVDIQLSHLSPYLLQISYMNYFYQALTHVLI